MAGDLDLLKGRGLVRAVDQMAKLLRGDTTFALLRRFEAAVQRLQGKGFGGGSVATEVASIVSLLPASGAVILDVGAHRGEWAAAVLASSAPTQIQRLVCFEPQRTNVDVIRSALRDKRVELVTRALGCEAGKRPLFGPGPGSGLASLHKRRLEHFDIPHEFLAEVDVTTLDTFVREARIDRIDFMKMDIEGNELATLEGATRCLEERRIRACSFEFGGCNIDSRTFFQDYWYLLTRYGFKIYRILQNRSLLRICRYTEDLECFKTTNYVAVLPP